MKNGFTLVELLVVIGIFSLLSGTVAGIFLSGLTAETKILSQQDLLNQISFIIEYMARDLRMAKKDDIAISGIIKDCLSGFKTNYEINILANEIKFRSYQNQCQRFFFSENKIWKEREGVLLPITSDVLKVNSVKFSILGQEQTDSLQPRVTIFLDIEGFGKNPPRIQIQTTISQRDLDVQY